MQEIILDSLVPIFFGMALGYLGGWTHHVDNRDVAQLNALVMDFALPAAVFAAVVPRPRISASVPAPVRKFACRVIILSLLN